MKQKAWVARMNFPDVRETLEQYFDVDVNCDDPLLTRDELTARVADKDGALSACRAATRSPVECGLWTQDELLAQVDHGVLVVPYAADSLSAALDCGLQAGHPPTPSNPDVLGVMRAC
ncbi:hypothetical protein SAMN04487769_3345 [Burkholderia sp. b14]|nr:hypothetical protein [Mycetohabitans sp. B3]MCG1038627.1 hypothetical protein [Mycetohabitans sp. B7]SIT81332.1 hypothetical protein SAMN04487769_3345 [Burkholderia sp. b14]